MPDSAHPAHRLRYCPFCGGSRFVWDGVKAHRCADCGHWLYNNPAAAVIAWIENDCGETLFVRRRLDPAKGSLDMPGGFVDCGEKAEEALVREVREEVHLELAEMRFVMTLPNTYLYDGLLYHTTDLVFRCRVEDWNPLYADDDASECLLLPPSAVNPAEVGLDSIRRLVQLIQSGVL